MPPDPQPKKDGTPYFIRLLKTLVRSNAMANLSGNAVKIILAVLTREDDLFRRVKVKLFNEELEAMTGLSKRTMMQAREEAVTAGALSYEPGTKSVRGIYSTLISETVKPIPVPKSQSLFADEDSEIEPLEVAAGNVARIDTESEIFMAENGTEQIVSVAGIDTESGICVAENDTENMICMAENDTENRVFMAGIDTHINPNTQNPSPNPSPAVSRIQNWGEVELRLLKLGLNAAAATVGEAERRGYSPELVFAIATHFERHPGAWHSPGVIRNAIVNYPAAMAADAPERWPALSQEFAARQRHARQIDRDETERVKREAHAANVQRDQVEREQREARFGKTLDSMNAEDMEALIDSATDAAAFRNYMNQFGLKSLTVRSRLLRMLEDRTSAIHSIPDPHSDGDEADEMPATIPFPRAC